MGNDITIEYSKDGFVCLSDILTDAVYDVRYYTSFNFTGEKIDGYDEECLFFSKEGASMLCRVSEQAKEMGYRLKIYDAYRPMRAIKHFLRWLDCDDEKMKEHFFPCLDKSDIVSGGYISPRSSHARGAAVDLTLIGLADGKELDMGCPFDYFGELSHPEFTGVTKEQWENRHILQKLMTDNGFRPISTEWWHFQLVCEPYPDTYFDFPVKR